MFVPSKDSQKTISLDIIRSERAVKATLKGRLDILASDNSHSYDTLVRVWGTLRRRALIRSTSKVNVVQDTVAEHQYFRSAAVDTAATVMLVGLPYTTKKSVSHLVEASHLPWGQLFRKLHATRSILTTS